MKKGIHLLRNALLIIGIVAFVLATIGEIGERAAYDPIASYVEEVAKEQGYESYASITDDEVREAVEQGAWLMVAKDTAAVNHGYKKFSKVKDEDEKAVIIAEAEAIAAEATVGESFLSEIWKPLLIAAVVCFAGFLAILLATRRPAVKPANAGKSGVKKLLQDQRVLLIIVIALLIVVVGCINPKFLKATNLVAIFQQISVLGILTMAQAMLLISGGIDLSMGNMMALIGVLVATLLMKGVSLVVAILGGMCAGILCGVFNGIVISKSRCIPLIITLGTGKIFYGIALLICGGSFLQFEGKLDFMRKISMYNFVPLMVIFMLAMVFLMYFLLSRTRFGRRIVAIGGNEKNAYLSGINVDLYKVITYAIGGLIVSVAALILGARLNSITATAGDGYETDALVAAIIGGVTFEGGRGTVFGAFLGCLLTGIISNALDILGVNAYVKVVISGAIIVGAVVLSNIDNLRKRR